MLVSYIEDNACGNFHFYLKKNWNVIPALASKSISMPFAVKFLRADFEKFGFCLQIISQNCNLQFLIVSFLQGLQAYKKNLLLYYVLWKKGEFWFHISMFNEFAS